MIRMFWRCFKSIDASFHRQAAQGLFDPGAQACSGHCGHADQTWTSGVTFRGSIGTRWIAAKHEVADIVELSHDTKRIRLSLGGKSTSLGGIRGNPGMWRCHVDVWMWSDMLGMCCRVWGLPVGKHIVIYAPNPEKCVSSNLWNGKPLPETTKVIENCRWIRTKLRPDPDKGKPEIDRKSLVSLRGMIAFSLKLWEISKRFQMIQAEWHK